MKLTYFQRIFSASAFNSFLNQQKIVFPVEKIQQIKSEAFEDGDCQGRWKLAWVFFFGFLLRFSSQIENIFAELLKLFLKDNLNQSRNI